jgi:hypothetical protein
VSNDSIPSAGFDVSESSRLAALRITLRMEIHPFAVAGE